MKNKKLVLLSVTILLFVFLISQAGYFLQIDDDSIRKTDVIIVCAGDKGERTELGAKIFREGYADYLVLSGGLIYYNTTIAELMRNHAVSLGVPENKIILESESNSTYQNAIYTKGILEKNNYKSAIVITSNYHMKRTKMIFERVFKGTSYELIFYSAKDRDFNPKFWWSNNKSTMLTINEYIKMIGYFFGKGS